MAGAVAFSMDNLPLICHSPGGYMTANFLNFGGRIFTGVKLIHFVFQMGLSLWISISGGYIFLPSVASANWFHNLFALSFHCVLRLSLGILEYVLTPESIVIADLSIRLNIETDETILRYYIKNIFHVLFHPFPRSHQCGKLVLSVVQFFFISSMERCKKYLFSRLIQTIFLFSFRIFCFQIFLFR